MSPKEDLTEWKSKEQRLQVIKELKLKMDNRHPKKREQAQTNLGKRPDAPHTDLEDRIIVGMNDD